MPPAKYVIDRDIERMGKEVGLIYAHLWAECIELNIAFGEFTALFEDLDNVRLFNSVAPAFFGNLQGLMIQDLMLRVSRMVDKSSRQTNLSLQVLRRKLSDSHQSALEPSFKLLEDSSNFAVDWRNKLYAHKDLSITLGNPVKPLPEVNRLHMEEAVKCINDIMDRIDQLFGGGVTVWDTDHGCASKRLISRLKVATPGSG